MRFESCRYYHCNNNNYRPSSDLRALQNSVEDLRKCTLAHFATSSIESQNTASLISNQILDALSLPDLQDEISKLEDLLSELEERSKNLLFVTDAGTLVVQGTLEVRGADFYYIMGDQENGTFGLSLIHSNT